MSDCIGINKTFGECYKVFITYSGGDGIENPLDLTSYLRKQFDSKFVFNQIKACLNPFLFHLAWNHIVNETYDYHNNYRHKENHTYPLLIKDGGRTMFVSLILLNNKPTNKIVLDALYRLCNLNSALDLARNIIRKAYFFNTEEEENNFYQHLYIQDIVRNKNLNTKKYIASKFAFIDGYFNEEKPLDIVLEINETQKMKYEDDKIWYFVHHPINYAVLETPYYNLKKNIYNINKITLSLLFYAKTEKGKEILTNVLNYATKKENFLFEHQKNQLHFIYKIQTDSNFQSIRFVGEGRFNPYLGYMPGSLIIAHEIGHTQFGGYYLDHINDGILNRKYQQVMNPKNGHYNIVDNENIMRKSYGMSKRTGYRENGICYDMLGRELRTSKNKPWCPVKYKNQYNLIQGVFSPVVR
jgi:hypothetical protein